MRNDTKTLRYETGDGSLMSCPKNLAGEFTELYQFERTLIDNPKKKLAVAAKSAN